MIISIAIVAILLIVPMVAHAAFTRSFGGKVKLTSVPLITCTGSGTGPVVISNTKGFPLYATDESNAPAVGDFILGKVNIIPEFSTCQLQVGTFKIPFPVTDTSKYKISGGSGRFGGFGF